MSITAVHSNIKEAIQKQLLEAKFIIYVSVAWFTDKDLFITLVKKAAEGVIVELIINDDSQKFDNSGKNISINFSDDPEINFHDLNARGGKVFLLKDNHNKFCIIDLKICISGSYNWTYGANRKENGLESIDIILDNSHANQKALEFKKLLKNCQMLEEVVPRPFFVNVRSISNQVVAAKKIDSKIIRLITEDNAEFYTTTDSIQQGCLLKNEADSKIYISQDFDPVQIAGMVWLDKRCDESKISNQSFKNDSGFPKEPTEPVNDLPF